MCCEVVWGGFEVVWGGLECFGVVWGVSTVPPEDASLRATCRYDMNTARRTGKMQFQLPVQSPLDQVHYQLHSVDFFSHK